MPHAFAAVLGEADTVFVDGLPIASVGDGNATLHDAHRPGSKEMGSVLKVTFRKRRYVSDWFPYGRPREVHLHRVAAKKKKGKAR